MCSNFTPTYSLGPAYGEARPDFADAGLWAGLPWWSTGDNIQRGPLAALVLAAAELWESPRKVS